MQSPFVSVIVPNYNHAPYLQQRIETVLSQTYQDFEIILLDDCSTDGSRDIIEQFRGHEKVSQVLLNTENSGNTFKQWVKGIELSKGTYIWIAESDDWCEPTFLETLMSGLQTNEHCVLGYCQSSYVDEGNNIIWQTAHMKLTDYISGEKFIGTHMLTGTAICNASMAVWRRDVFEKIPKDFLQYKTCGDWLFWIEISRLGDVFISGKLLNYFRKHPGNVSSKAVLSGENFLEELRMFHSLYNKAAISKEDYLKSIEREYVEFKGIRKSLDPLKRASIKALFFREAGVRFRLTSYYWKFYLKNIVSKLSNRIIVGSNTSG